MAQHIHPFSYEGSPFPQEDWGYLHHCFDGVYGEGKSQNGYVCLTTGPTGDGESGSSDPHISITLPVRCYVETIKVWNRHECCRDRYSNHIWTVDGVTCINSADSSDDFAIVEECGLSGTIVRLTLPGPDRWIQLQEIELWGWAI